MFILLAQLYFVGSDAVSLGVAAGAISQEQIIRVSSYALLDSALPWIWVTGLIAFGISVYRAQVFPKAAGMLLVLLGLIQPFAASFLFVRIIYAACYFAVWAWLGWDLYSKAAIQSNELPEVQQSAIVNVTR
jgi:hypothetical protein